LKTRNSGFQKHEVSGRKNEVSVQKPEILVQKPEVSVGLKKRDLGPSGHGFDDKEHKLTLYYKNWFYLQLFIKTPHITPLPSDGKTPTD
jgi:hypothetical protein